MSVVSLLVVLLFVSYASCHYVDPSQRTFPIALTSSGSHSVHLDSSPTTTCTFSYQTRPRTLAAVQSKTIDLATFIRDETRVRSCTQSQSNGWNYEVCLGAEGVVRQSLAGDVYILGRNPQQHDLQILYDDGMKCAAADNKPRTTKVVFACHPDHTSLTLYTVAEPSTCQYLITLTSAQLCDDPRFTKMSGSGGGTSDDEDWMMEITDIHDGNNAVQTMCQVYSTETRATTSALNFATFNLKIDKLSATKIVRHTVRHPERVHVNDDEITVNALSIKSTALFSGKLAIVKAVA